MAHSTKPISLRVLLQVLVFVVAVPFLPLLVSRRWDWWEAWVFALLYILSFAASRLALARRSPDLIAERARFVDHADVKPWDKTIVQLMTLGNVLLVLVPGLEALIRAPGMFPGWVKALAMIGILTGSALAMYAMLENRFFSGVVRIQTERGHHVVTGGPYRWIRHPGYAGGIITYLATPFLLDSLWALLPAVVTSAIIILRTRLEDSTLRRELPGYDDYARRVRHRLVPGVW
jgi:protein-S-isoprenylcysteine O-methyltransferase Ste14